MKESPNGLISTLESKCPRCRKGYIFEKQNPYHLKYIFKTNRFCSECGKSFMPEPNFFEGSMYVNYAFSVALVVSVFVAFNVLFEKPNITYMISIAIGTAFLAAPLTIRLSRSVWASIFFSYDKNATEKFKNGNYEP